MEGGSSNRMILSCTRRVVLSLLFSETSPASPTVLLPFPLIGKLPTGFHYSSSKPSQIRKQTGSRTPRISADQRLSSPPIFLPFFQQPAPPSFLPPFLGCSSPPSFDYPLLRRPIIPFLNLTQHPSNESRRLAQPRRHAGGGQHE